ncbi:MAG: hypothetical protein GY925_07695 [Actinomycetia bacterium]|nr:hypothetical protein [Actinomycetes bacterium]
MPDVEDQIRLFADQVFAHTSPVLFEQQPIGRRAHRGRRLAAVAAALLLVGGAGVAAWWARLNQPQTLNITSIGLSIEDPLHINLPEPESPGRRVSGIGLALTFEFDQLPSEWVIEQLLAVTLPGPEGMGPKYWQQVVVTMPNEIELVVNVEGRLDGSQVTLEESDPTSELTDVRGQPARMTASRLAWVEQGQARVEIVRGPNPASGDTNTEMLALADALAPVDRELDWSLGPAGPSSSQAGTEVLLAGAIGGTPWRVMTQGTGLQFFAATERRSTIGVIDPNGPGPNSIRYSIDPIEVPGGALVWGYAPGEVTSVRLGLSPGPGSVDLPAVAINQDQVAFAVPISDALDPIAIDFLDRDGQLVGSITLSDLPPYLGGSTGGTVDAHAN